MIGLSNRNITAKAREFYTSSGRTKVELVLLKQHASTIDLEAHILLTDQMTCSGLDNDRGRKILSSRIDVALSGIASVKRKAGTSLPFDTYIEFMNIPLTLDGASKCRDIL